MKMNNELLVVNCAASADDGCLGGKKRAKFFDCLLSSMSSRGPNSIFCFLQHAYYLDYQVRLPKFNLCQAIGQCPLGLCVRERPEGLHAPLS